MSTIQTRATCGAIGYRQGLAREGELDLGEVIAPKLEVGVCYEAPGKPFGPDHPCHLATAVRAEIDAEIRRQAAAVVAEANVGTPLGDAAEREAAL